VLLHLLRVFLLFVLVEGGAEGCAEFDLTLPHVHDLVDLGGQVGGYFDDILLVERELGLILGVNCSLLSLVETGEVLVLQDPASTTVYSLAEGLLRGEYANIDSSRSIASGDALGSRSLSSLFFFSGKL
jgi:hypothetical protein